METVDIKPLTLVSGKRVFLTSQGDCAKFNDDFDQYCFENGLGMMVGRRPELHMPVEPHPRVIQRYYDGRSFEGERSLVKEYLKKEQEWIRNVVRIRSLYKQCVDADIWLEVEQRIQHFDERTFKKFQNIRYMVNQLYGGYTQAKGRENFRKIQAVPSFTSTELVTSGIAELKILFKEREGWCNRRQVYTDADKVGFLREKMEDWDKLECVLTAVREDDETYDQLVKRVLTKNQDLKSKALARKIKRMVKRKLFSIISCSRQG